MDLLQIAKTRLVNQQIAGTKMETVKELVAWMGAIQAQDFPMSRLAIGSRLPGCTDRQVEAAFARGEILRTHVMRPTWHIVSAADIYWMLELTAAQVTALARSRHRDLGLTAEVFSKTRAIIEKTLAGGGQLTRPELVAEFEKAQIATNENRTSHILMQAELEGLICSGAGKAGKSTYALLEEWVPKPAPISRDEALARLAGRYFSSHGPATLQDFAWWSGLKLSEAGRALEMIKSEFTSKEVNQQTYWFADQLGGPQASGGVVYLLPAYDEIIISYTDRRAAMGEEYYNQAVSSNGIFRPVILVKDQVGGLWKWARKAKQLLIEMEFFRPPDETALSLAEKAALEIGRFLEMKTEINPFAKIEPLKTRADRKN